MSDTPEVTNKRIRYLTDVESKRVRGNFFASLGQSIRFILALYLLVVAVILLGTGSAVERLARLKEFPQVLKQLTRIWPESVDPLTSGIAITSIAIAMSVVVAVLRLPSPAGQWADEATVEEYIRRLHLVNTAEIASRYCGLVLAALASVLVWSGGYRSVCAVLLYGLGLFCFRLNGAIPVPDAYWVRNINAEESLNRIASHIENTLAVRRNREGKKSRLILRIAGRMALGAMIAPCIFFAVALWPEVLYVRSFSLLLQAVAVLGGLGLIAQLVLAWACFYLRLFQLDDQPYLSALSRILSVVVLYMFLLLLGLQLTFEGSPAPEVGYAYFASLIAWIGNVTFLTRSSTWKTLQSKWLETRKIVIEASLRRYNDFIEARSTPLSESNLLQHKERSLKLCAISSPSSRPLLIALVILTLHCCADSLRRIASMLGLGPARS